MRAQVTLLACLLTGTAAQAADVRAIPPSAAAAQAPQTVQDAAPRPARDANSNPFPCLFGCSTPEPVQAAAAPEPAAPSNAAPEREVARKRVRHAFAKAPATKQEGRSVATARKVSRSAASPIMPQKTAYRPDYAMPLDVDAVPLEWQLRAEPPKTDAMRTVGEVGPFGTLKNR